MCGRFLLDQFSDFTHPAAALSVIEVHHFREGPMDVTPEKGYLLVDPVQGVAGYPPNGGTSTSWR